MRKNLVFIVCLYYINFLIDIKNFRIKKLLFKLQKKYYSKSNYIFKQIKKNEFTQAELKYIFLF